MVHANVDHISGITKSSPYLFFSLFLLTWNTIFTIHGVRHNEGDQLASYIASLVLFFSICLIVLLSKCLFIWCRTKISRHQCRKLAGTLLFDFIFVVMGTLYLAGDNLPVLHCSGMNSTTAKDNCMEQSTVIVGISLLLHTALYVAGALKLKPTEVTAFPVTGRIRKAYQGILQLVAFTIILDQTFSTVVRLITNITDIETDESTNCGSTEKEVEGFLASLYIIMLFIVLGLAVKKWKNYCSCCRIKRKSMFIQCCCHLWENILIFILNVFAIAFMVIYTLADNRWLYRCTPVSMGDTTLVRRRMLWTSLFLSLLWIVLYLFVICLPGVGIVCKKRRFFTENDYISVKAKRKKHEWVCEDARVKRKGKAYGYIDLTSSTDTTVEENYGSVSITLPIEEEITCQNGVLHCIEAMNERCIIPNTCMRVHEHYTPRSILLIIPCCGIICCCLKFKLTKCLKRICCNHCEDDITCVESLQNCRDKCMEKECCKDIVCWCEEGWDWCKSRWECCKECCEKLIKKIWKKDTQTAEDEEMIMLTYLGKKENVKYATLPPGGTQPTMRNDQQQEYPARTPLYIWVPPPTFPPQDTERPTVPPHLPQRGDAQDENNLPHQYLNMFCRL